MALYEVTGPDGKQYEVEGPAGATDAQIINAVTSQLREQERIALEERLAQQQERTTAALFAQEDEEDAGFLENIATGLGAGAVNVGESALLGAIAPLDEGAELAAREKIQAAADALRPEGGDKESITYNLSQAVGSILGIAAPAVIGAAAAPAAIPAAAAGTGIAGLLSVGAGAGEASERARAAGATEEERGRATLIGAPIGALDILPLGRALKVIDVPVITKFLDRFGPDDPVEGFRRYAQNAAVTAGAEGLQETTSAILQNLNELGYNKEAEIIGSALEEGGYGAGAGGIIQFISDIAGARRRAKAKKGGLEPNKEELEQSLVEDQGELFGDEFLGSAPAEQVIRNNPNILDLTNTEFDEYNPGLPEGRDYKDLGIPDEDTYFEIAAIRNQPDAQRELFAGALGRAPERAGEPDQLDLFGRPATPQPEAVQPDMIEEAETAQVQEMIQAEERAVQEQAELQTASELETIAGRLETQQLQATEQRRTAILQDVIENTPTRQEDTLAKSFSRAL